jgi:hypothetical protein
VVLLMYGNNMASRSQKTEALPEADPNFQTRG